MGHYDDILDARDDASSRYHRQMVAKNTCARLATCLGVATVGDVAHMLQLRWMARQRIAELELAVKDADHVFEAMIKFGDLAVATRSGT